MVVPVVIISTAAVCPPSSATKSPTLITKCLGSETPPVTSQQSSSIKILSERYRRIPFARVSISWRRTSEDNSTRLDSKRHLLTVAGSCNVLKFIIFSREVGKRWKVRAIAHSVWSDGSVIGQCSPWSMQLSVCPRGTNVNAWRYSTQPGT